MEATACTPPKEPHQHSDKEIVPVHPFSQEWVTITKEEHIDLIQRASYWEAQVAECIPRLASDSLAPRQAAYLRPNRCASQAWQRPTVICALHSAMPPAYTKEHSEFRLNLTPP